MKTFALIEDQIVDNIILSENNISDINLIDVTDVTPPPAIGQGYDSSTSTFIPNPDYTIRLSDNSSNTLSLSPDIPSIDCVIDYSTPLSLTLTNHLVISPENSVEITNFSYNSELNQSTVTFSTGSNKGEALISSNPITTLEGIEIPQINNYTISFNEN